MSAGKLCHCTNGHRCKVAQGTHANWRGVQGAGKGEVKGRWRTKRRKWWWWWWWFHWVITIEHNNSTIITTKNHKKTISILKIYKQNKKFKILNSSSKVIISPDVCLTAFFLRRLIRHDAQRRGHNRERAVLRALVNDHSVHGRHIIQSHSHILPSKLMHR